MWLIFAFASAFFAGITAVLAKTGIRNADSDCATAIRTVIILVFAWLMVFITGAQGGITSVSGHTMLFLVLSGLATGLSWICYFRALQLGDVNKVAPVDKSSTILAIIFAFIFLGEKINAMKLFAVVLIALGTFMMITVKKSTETKSSAWLFYALLSAVAAAMTSILGKIGISGIDSNLGTAIRTIVVLIMAWLIVFMEKKQSLIKKIDKKSMLFICLSGITTGMSWLCYYRALQTGEASVVVPIDKLSILVTILFSGIFLHEKLNKKSAVGLVVLTAGTLAIIFA